MKKIIIVVLVLIVAAIVALLVVNSITNSPKGVVRRFIRAIEKNDIKAMSEVATQETVQLITMLGTKAQGMIVAHTSRKPKSVTEIINGDTAVVVVILDNDDELYFDLVKINGKWKVSIDTDFKGSSSPSYK